MAMADDAGQLSLEAGEIAPSHKTAPAVALQVGTEERQRRPFHVCVDDTRVFTVRVKAEQNAGLFEAQDAGAHLLFHVCVDDTRVFTVRVKAEQKAGLFEAQDAGVHLLAIDSIPA